MDRVDADIEQLQHPAASEDLPAIDEALKELTREKPAVGKLVELKFFEL